MGSMPSGKPAPLSIFHPTLTPTFQPDSMSSQHLLTPVEEDDEQEQLQIQTGSKRSSQFYVSFMTTLPWEES